MFLAGLSVGLSSLFWELLVGAYRHVHTQHPSVYRSALDQAYVGTFYLIDLAENQIKYFISYFHISSSLDMSETCDWFLMYSYSVMILHFRLLRIAKETLIIAAPFYAKFCSLSRSGTFGFAND